jgi:hypothetical protein
MEILESSIKCIECRNILDRPVLLPCGESICQSHLNKPAAETPTTYQCFGCGNAHVIPEGGFFLNKALHNIINTKIEKIKLLPEYDNACKSCKRLSAHLDQFGLLKKDPYFFIYEALNELKVQTQMLREEYKLKIDERADRILEELIEYETECKTRLDTTAYAVDLKDLDEIVAEIRAELQEWTQLLSKFDASEADWVDIKHASNVYAIQLESRMSQIRNELLLSRKYNDSKSKVIEFTNGFELHSEWNFLIQSDDESPRLSAKFESKILDSKLENQLEKLCGFAAEQKWKLLYRASEHGFMAQSFHSKCDNVPCTLTIVRSANNGNVFGGYTEAMWDKTNVYRSDRRAFIFSLVNKYSVPTRMSVNSDTGTGAVVGNGEYGPIFGQDIIIANNSNINTNSSSKLGSSYKHPSCLVSLKEAKNYLAGEANFQVSEIEVYQKL